MMARPASGKSQTQLIYWVALAAIFVFATWQRFTLPLDPIADPDTWGYLSPALRKLAGAEFGHTHGRNFIYPGFLFLLLPFGGEYELGVKSLEFPLHRETWTAYPPAVDFMDHARFLARTRHWFNSGPSFASRSVF